MRKMTLGRAIAAVLAVLVLAQSAQSAPSFLKKRNFTSSSSTSISRASLAKRLGSDTKTLGVCTTNLAFLNLGTATIPAEFNADTHWPECIPSVYDQGQCGSCWAFAVTGVLAQRMCIAGTNITKDLRLSPQDMITCDKSCSNSLGASCTAGQLGCMCQAGCSGGYPDLAFKTMATQAITAEHCVPYKSGGGSDPFTCSDVQNSISTCTLENPTDTKQFTAGQCYHFTSIADMQRDIMKNGPIQAAFKVYEDFYGYADGVYTCPTGETSVGGHAIIIVGWGVENGINYWLCRNSWSEGWGSNGYFKIKRGSDECDIETYANAALPNVQGVSFSSAYNSASLVAPLLWANIALVALASILAL